MPLAPSPRAILTLLATAVAIALAPAAMAAPCVLTPSIAVTSGPYSPAAVKAAAVPALPHRGGLSCSPSLVAVATGTYIRATLRSANGMKLNRTGGGGSIGYLASADPAGAWPFSQGGTVNYLQGELINALGLLGGTSADMPVYLKLAAATAAPAEGTYTDRITITWNWFLCPGGVSITSGLCLLGEQDRGTNRQVTIDVTVTVAARDVTVAFASATVWDPTNEGENPRDLPGSRRRASVTVTNPDLVALDAGTLALVLPTPAGTLVALDGDKVSSGSAVRMAAPAAGVSVRYDDPASTADDVDFSADDAATWGFVPVAGDLASEGKVTHVRIRPRGAMAAQSSFSVSVPFLVR